MKKIIFCIISLLFIFPVGIKAYECSNEDKERLQKLANNVSVTIAEQDDGSLSAVFSGVSTDIRILNPKNWMYYRNLSSNYIGEIVIDNLQQGSTHRFEIYSSGGKCIVENFRTITVNVPSVNPYYGDAVCKEATNYSLCQKWTTVNMTHDEFINKVNRYIQTNANQNDDQIQNSNNKGFSFLIFYEKYYWPTFAGMTIILGLLIFLWIKENKKNEL